MKKYKCGYGFYQLVDKHPHIYAVESEIATRMLYIFTADEVAVYRHPDAWRMTYKEAEELAGECKYPAIREEFRQIIKDAKVLKRQGNTLFYKGERGTN